MNNVSSQKRNWILAFAVTTVFAAAQATQVKQRVTAIPWLELYALELPVWYGLLMVSPIIFWLARRFPLVGPRKRINFVAHFLSAIVVLFIQFVTVEFLRGAVIQPLVLRTGIASNSAGIAYAHIAENASLIVRALSGFKYYSVIFFVFYFALVIFYYSIFFYRQSVRTEVRAQELQTLLAKSQLESLKLQLQPHFLFNTLNTVSSLMSRDVVLARKMLARLSDLLRETLRDVAIHEVPLSGEMQFLDTYLEIQRARFGSRLAVRENIASDTLDLLVPRMILQPLVENATRHGMRDGDQRLTVEIDSFRDGDFLQLRVSDDGAGLVNRELQEGLGLRNTRERLSQLYGSNCDMEVETPSTGGFAVRITVPARQSEIDVDDASDKREIA